MPFDVIGQGVHLVQGDDACAMGAIAAGCTFCAYYPITPASEIAETISRMMPMVGGIAIQMEDELASVHAASGASVAGRKAMTLTSGPGFSLKMDGLGWAIKNEVPLVIIDVQRAGPANGVATNVGQGDFYQARYGTHGGNYEIIALSPASIQETFDLMTDAFNLSEIYRCPVIFLMDEIIAHTREKLMVPPIGEREARIVSRKSPSVPPEEYALFGELLNPEAINVPFPAAGDGYGICVSPYTHTEKGYPTESLYYQDLMAKRLVYKVRAHADALIRFESMHSEDANLALVSWGCTARAALTAVRQLRDEGTRIGYLRLINVWPFPDKPIRDLAEAVDTIFVAECNIDGQLVREVERASHGQAEVVHIGKAGVEMHTPGEIVAEIKRYLGQKRG